ncbi:SDR family NAD(P)-dependent oxidoreductase [Shewanella sp. UCD-KL12]|uniref:SDR family NAD(P)-dependent oxidoreductase n=1 Tax=Shewanella sp. UCD-KL12 TaxID=1917163 RepID=UPI0009705135|nr:glucose 1-dehydrogenase [Shewanella sp. UCD-KL12]
MSHKVALITGGATGIGKATAEKLIRQGYHVVISGRRAEQGKDVEKELNELAFTLRNSARALFLQNDVTDEEQVISMVDYIVKEFGSLDMAVNNAGLANETKTIGDSTTQAFKQMLDTNVLGLFYCMRSQIEQMRKQGSGSIVNLASIAGLNGMPWSGTYAATKHAVVGLTKSAALDHALENIRINAVAPGAIKTDIISGAIELGTYDENMIAQMHPMNRMGNPQEVANGICWLLSNEASFVTGHILNIDGGFQAK